jgi:hypothetical protein
MMEKVAAEIVEKLTHGGPPAAARPAATLQPAAAATAPSPHPGSPTGHFDFNIIDGDNPKSPRSFSLKDRPFLTANPEKG